MRVIVTRPAEQAQVWVESFRARGIDAVALPLIDIAAPFEAQPVHDAWRSLTLCRLVVFVSPNAAQQFFNVRPEGLLWPSHVLAASVGPGTTQTLLDLGVPASMLVQPDPDSVQFDSEALWQQLRQHDWTGARVLIVRGAGGRDWLADMLIAGKANVAFVSAYRRVLPTLDQKAEGVLRDAVERPQEHLWFFSSSEAVDNLMQLLPAATWGDARAVATHDRIAQRATEAGFRLVRQARPTVDALVACIQSAAS